MHHADSYGFFYLRDSDLGHGIMLFFDPAKTVSDDLENEFSIRESGRRNRPALIGRLQSRIIFLEGRRWP